MTDAYGYIYLFLNIFAFLFIMPSRTHVVAFYLFSSIPERIQSQGKLEQDNKEGRNQTQTTAHSIRILKEEVGGTAADIRHGHLVTYITPQHIITLYTLWRKAGRKPGRSWHFLFIQFISGFEPFHSHRAGVARCWLGVSNSSAWAFFLFTHCGFIYFVIVARRNGGFPSVLGCCQLRVLKGRDYIVGG